MKVQLPGNRSLFSAPIVGLLLAVSCQPVEPPQSRQAPQTPPPDGSGSTSSPKPPEPLFADLRGKTKDPIFSDKVHRIDITLEPSVWRSFQNSIDEIWEKQKYHRLPPRYFECTVKCEDRTWNQVAIRYKGGSTLKEPYRQGKKKLPFRLHFSRLKKGPSDATSFYGYQKLTFANGFYDPSFVREKLAGELMLQGGVPAPKAAYYRVFFQVGKRAMYGGLYTMIEDPDGPMVDRYYGRGGNLYKPSTRWARFSKRAFEKKNNRRKGDYTDVEKVIAALISVRVETDRPGWRNRFEAVFDVNLFLRWLAINSVIGNQDAYPFNPRNQYLYAAPVDRGRIKWIPWDLDRSFRGGYSVLFENVGSRRPLIRRLLDDPVYKKNYLGHLRQLVNEVVQVDRVTGRIDAIEKMISPYVLGDQGESADYTCLKKPEHFPAGVKAVKRFVSERPTAIKEFLQRTR